MNVTMKDKLKMMFASTAVISLVLTGCVSTKKYKASQAMLQQVRNDSAQLAQQTASLNGNVKELQERNAALQRSLDSSTTNYTEQKKNLSYYQDYFTQQQTAMGQMTDQLKTALSQAGVGDADVTQENNVIYVRLDEDKIFKKNSYVVSSDGKKALTALAGSIKDRPDVNVFISDGDSSGGNSTAMAGNGSMSSNNNTSGSDMNNNGSTSSSSDMTTHHVVHHRVHHYATSAHGTARANGTGHSGGSQPANTQSTTDTTATAVAHHHHKIHHRYQNEEAGSMTYYSNNMGNSHRSRAMALQQGRMYAVANNMLHDGVPKVNLLLRQENPEMNQSSNTIKVIIKPAMNDFKPQTASRE